MGGFAKAASGVGVTDHGALTGLGDDDHLQYFKTLDVQEGAVSVVSARDMALDYDAADFNVVDGGGGTAEISLAVTPIAGIDVQEGGGSVVAAATALNFVANDFAITDEGGNVAGIALDASLFAGVYLAIDGSNRMQVGAEIRTLHGVLSYEVSALIGDQQDSFADSDLNLGFWAEGLSDEADLGEGEGGGYYEWIAEANITNVSQSTGHGSISTLNTYQGDFEVIARLTHFITGASVTDDSLALAAMNAGDWTPGGAFPAAGDRAQIGGVSVTGTGKAFSSAVTGTSQLTSRSGADDYWVRIVRVGTTITVYTGTSVGSDVPPGSWAVHQTKPAAGLDDEVNFVLFFFPTGSTGTMGNTSWARVTQFTVISADTINAAGIVPGPGFLLNVNPDLDTDGILLRGAYDVTSATVTHFDFIRGATSHALSLYPADAGAERLTLTLKDDGIGQLGTTGAGALQLNPTSEANIQLFEDVASEAASRRLVLYGYDDGLAQKVFTQFYHADQFFFLEADGDGDGIILRHDGTTPTIRLLQTGSTGLTVITQLSVFGTPTVKLQHGGGAANRGYLEIQARSTATAAPGVIDIRNVAGNGLFLTPTTDYRLAIWENNDPVDASGTPDAMIPGMRSTSGGEFDGSPDLTQNIDLGLRTDAPISLAMNVGGTYRRLAFGAFDEYAGMYTTAGSADVTVATAGSFVLVTSWLTAYGESRRAVADPTVDDDITIATAGVYFIACQISFSATGGAVVNFKLTTTGGTVDIPGASCVRKIAAGGDTGTTFLMGIETLAATDVVELYVTSDDDGDIITPIEAQFIAFKIGE